MAIDGWEEAKDIDPYEDDDKPRPSETPKSEYEEDALGREYNPNAGSQSYTKGRCNATLRFWKERYGEKRYCTRLPEKYFVDGGSEFCKTHKAQGIFMEHASEMLKHGYFSKSAEHLFDKLDGWEKVFVVAIFEELMEDSRYDYEPEYVPITVEFDDEAPLDFLDSDATEESKVELGFPNPTSKVHRALALFKVSTDEIKQVKMNEVLLENNLTSESVEHTADSDGRITDTITEEKAHYLHLPYSRLVKDEPELLKYGGVEIGDDNPDKEVTMNVREWASDLPSPESPSVEEGTPIEIKEEDKQKIIEEASDDE